jgi:hypothetical protein
VQLDNGATVAIKSNIPVAADRSTVQTVFEDGRRCGELEQQSVGSPEAGRHDR